MIILQKITAAILTPFFVLASWAGVLPEPQVIIQEVPKTEELSVGAFNPTGGSTYRLKSSISSTDTSINLSSFKEPRSDIPYTMNYLNSSIGYGTIEPQSSYSEFISFTGITQNSDGSAVLTGVTRGLTRTPAGSTCTASTTLAVKHAAQSQFILSDSPCFYAQYAVKGNDETISGSWTVPTPTAAGNPTPKSYVDSLVNGGAVSYDKIVVAATAGETFATGTIVFFDQYQDEWMKADADLASTSRNVLLGVSQGGGTNGSGINGGVLLRGLDSTNTGVAANDGSFIYLSNTAGATSTSVGTLEVLLGMRRSTSAFYFDPTLSDNRLSTNNTFTGTNTFATTTFSGFVTSNGVATSTIASSTIRVYTSNDTWTKPSGIKYAKIRVQGGGGGGGGVNNGGTNTATGGGGGGGGYCEKTIPAVALGTSETVTVGSAGTGGTAYTASSTAGGNSSFGSHCTGGGGGRGIESRGAPQWAGTPGTAGTASSGDININGTKGRPLVGSLTSTPIGGSAVGGDSFMGFGGNSPHNGDGGGDTGIGYGGGGGGAISNGSGGFNGGNGAPGIIIVEEFYY